MTCRKCGELLEDYVKFCPVCGTKQAEDEPREEASVLNPVHSPEADCAHEGHVDTGSKSVGFLEAFKLFFLRYADFKGRSRRSEYWLGCLSVSLLGIILSGILGDFMWIWSLVIWLPNFALSVRRLHDIGRSGWWLLINLVPLAGSIIYLIWACQDSGPDNQWGPNPKG